MWEETELSEEEGGLTTKGREHSLEGKAPYLDKERNGYGY